VQISRGDALTNFESRVRRSIDASSDAP